MLRGVVAGLGLGILWGGVARLFMRLLTDDPQFSWEGTLFIVGLSAGAAALVGLVRGALRSGRSGWWRLAALPGLALFAGPGLVLLPTAVGMAMVMRGGPVVRVLGALVATGTPLLLVASAGEVGGLGAAQLPGVVLLLASTVPLGWGIGEVVRRRPRPDESTGDVADRVGGPREAVAVA